MNYKKPGGTRPFRLFTTVRLGAAAVAACFIASPLLANPVNPTVVNGAASFNQVGNVLTVTNSNGAIINWDKFSIKAGETTHFAQAAASSTVLNRVLNDPTAIYGTLSSNGRVWLVNPAGIMVGPGGRVDTAAFVASTLNISNENFLAGRHLFINDGSAKDVINQGEIRTPAGGSVYLIGSNTSNEGIITTPKGETILAAGATVSLIDSATPGVKVDITGAAGNSTNLGQITAEAGRIGIAGVIVRNSGLLNASSVVAEGGRIFLKASQDAYVDQAGRIVTTGTQGGTVEVLGNRVAVMDSASIDASGENGGGRIMIGGDYQGKNPDIPNANITYFGPDAALRADATKVGSGGTVIVWADDTTRAYGSISAKGGAAGGDGGFVETSGKNYLDINGISVRANAPKGVAGTWLLDPIDLYIVNGAGMGSLGPPSSYTLAPPSTGSLLSDATINDTLAAGTNLTIQTTGGSGGNGDIFFDASYNGALSISYGGTAASLTLNAGRDIKFIGGSTTFQSTAGTLDVVFNPASGRKVEVQSGGTVVFDGSSGTLAARMGTLNATTKWDNYGVVTLSGVSFLDLNNGNSSAFYNYGGGILNLASTQGYAIQGVSGVSGDPFNNSGGTINVSSGTAIEAMFNQSSGTINIDDTKNLNLQNAITLSGLVNLNATGALNINENHGIGAALSNLTFGGTGGSLSIGGIMALPGKIANMTNVSAPNVALTLGAGGVYPGYMSITNGDAAFKSVTFSSGGLAAMTNGTLGVTIGNFAIPAGVTYSGNVGYLAAGTLTLPVSTPISTSGSITLGAGWDGASVSSPVFTPGASNLALSSNLFSGGNLNLYAGGTITFNPVTPSGTNYQITYADTSNSFTNTFSGGYLAGGNLNVLAGGSVNIGGASPFTGVGSVGNGAVKIVSGWDGASVATPVVAMYSSGNIYNINIENATLFATGGGSINLDAADNAWIHPTAVSAYSGISADTGHVSVTANSIVLTAFGVSGGGSGASIRSNGNQDFIVKGAGGGAGLGLRLEGAGVAGSYGGMAGIEAFGATSAQSFVIQGGAPVLLKAGFGGFDPTAHDYCPANTCTGNRAGIRNLGNGGQSFVFANNSSSLTLYGGGAGAMVDAAFGGGNDNNASINNKGTGLLSISGVGAIALYSGLGGGSGGMSNNGHENGADIDSHGGLQINASSIRLDATGGAVYGGAFIGGPSIDITTSGGLSMYGGAHYGGTALDPLNPHPANYVFYNPAAIGWDQGTTNIQLNVGSLYMSGGYMGTLGGSMAMIGGAHGASANVQINSQADISMASAYQFSDRIGSTGLGSSVELNSGLGGTGIMTLGKGLMGTSSDGHVGLHALGTGGSITQVAGATGGRIGTASLVATASAGPVYLGGTNRVGDVDLSAAGGIYYNSGQSFHIDAAGGPAQSVTITTAGASVLGGDIFVGSVGAAGATTIDVIAHGGIYDDNGAGVINLTGNIVNLTSYGGHPGNLAISADVLASSAINANVVVGASYGGIAISNWGAQPASGISLFDNALYAGGGLNGGLASISFHNSGDLALAGGTSFVSSNNGDMLISSGGRLDIATGASMIGTAGGSLLLAAGSVLDLNTAGGGLSVSGSLGLIAPVVTIHGGGGIGTITATGDISIVAPQQLNIGNYDYTGISGANIGVDTGYLSMQTGALYAVGNLAIAADSVNATADSLLYGSNISASIRGYFGLSGGSFMSASNDISLTAGSLGLAGSGIYAGNHLLAVVGGDANIIDGHMATGSGDLELVVGGDLNAMGAGSYLWAGDASSPGAYQPDASIAVGGDLKLNDGAHINAANDVFLDLLGATSTLVLNDGTPGYSPSYILSDIGTGVIGTTHLSFVNRSSGGVMIDGQETTTTTVGGSGFFAVNTSTPALPGAGLTITLAAQANDAIVAELVNALTSVIANASTMESPTEANAAPPPPDTVKTDPTQPPADLSRTTGGTEGSFGSESGGPLPAETPHEEGGSKTAASGQDEKKDEKKEDKKDEKKDKKSDDAKDGKKDEKSAAKKVAQCS